MLFYTISLLPSGKATAQTLLPGHHGHHSLSGPGLYSLLLQVFNILNKKTGPKRLSDLAHTRAVIKTQDSCLSNPFHQTMPCASVGPSRFPFSLQTPSPSLDAESCQVWVRRAPLATSSARAEDQEQVGRQPEHQHLPF